MAANVNCASASPASALSFTAANSEFAALTTANETTRKTRTLVTQSDLVLRPDGIKGKFPRMRVNFQVLEWNGLKPPRQTQETRGEAARFQSAKTQTTNLDHYTQAPAGGKLDLARAQPADTGYLEDERAKLG